MTVAVPTEPKTRRTRKTAATGPSPGAVPTSPAQVLEIASSDVFERVSATYEEYLDRLGEDGIVEWANGEALIHMPPGRRHQNVSDYLLTLLRQYVEYRELGQVVSAPFEVKLGEGKASREPDILFVARENLDRLTDQRLLGPADLAVEVISPSTAQHDRATKFEEYQEAGVREYWLIDPRPGKERADFWVLGMDDRYLPVPPGDDGVYHSAVLPGFWFDTRWLVAPELPNTMKTLIDMVGGPERLIAYVRELSRLDTESDGESTG
jgi:Uma2 family endonuclease